MKSLAKTSQTILDEQLRFVRRLTSMSEENLQIEFEFHLEGRKLYENLVAASIPLMPPTLIDGFLKLCASIATVESGLTAILSEREHRA